MNVYCVSYDLLAPGKSYDALIAEITNSPSWAKPLKSLFLVETNESPEQLYNRLRPKMDANDLILIVRVCRDYYGFFNKEVIEWIDQHVRLC